jgi:hypothetical protein
MEKISRFINIVPAIPNTTIIPDNHQRRRNVQNYSRFRRFRGHRRINQRIVKPSIQNNESTTIEEISDEVNILFFLIIFIRFYFRQQQK